MQMQSAASMETTTTTTTETVAAAVLNLPDDVLAGVLGLLPARGVAASRRVCKAWRDLIDERQLLLRLRRLLPHSVRGLFFNYNCCFRPYFFSRPPSSSSSGGPRIDGKFDFIQPGGPRYMLEVLDHCNGLVLCLEMGSDVMKEVLHVCNPTTRWSESLPPLSVAEAGKYRAWPRSWCRRAFLVFDPFVSPEYKVLLSPPDTEKKLQQGKDDDDDACRLQQTASWPPSPWTSWHEFSSRTGRWEEKAFLREGEAACTAGDILQLVKWSFNLQVEPPWRYAAYWQGALYVHCGGEYVSRFSLEDGKYRVIRSPIQLAERKNNSVRSFLGRSEKGVYIAAITNVGLAKLRVWTLSECGNQMGYCWVPMHQSNLKINTGTWWLEKKKLDAMKYWFPNHEPKFWALSLDQEISNAVKKQEASLEQNVCWDSDEENIMEVSDDEEEGREYIQFLGFHPYKEVIFLYADGYAVAFHMNSPKVQYLGPVRLHGISGSVQESFVYTPCLV